jgi:hypothetical protein
LGNSLFEVFSRGLLPLKQHVIDLGNRPVLCLAVDLLFIAYVFEMVPLQGMALEGFNFFRYFAAKEEALLKPKSPA